MKTVSAFSLENSLISKLEKTSKGKSEKAEQACSRGFAFFSSRLSNPLLLGSLFVLVGSFGANFINYLFQLLAGRNLSVEGYGVLITLLSIQVILGVPTTILNTSIIKVVSELKAKGDSVLITSLFIWFFKFIFILSLAFIAFSFLFRGFILDFLRVESFPLLLVFSFYFSIFLFTAIPASFLQGLLHFRGFAVFSLLAALSRLLFGIGLTLIFHTVLSTLTGLLVGILASLIISFLLLRKDLVFNKHGDISKWVHRVLRFAMPSSLALISLAVLFNVDVVLVRHFFDPVQAGIYSSLVVIGRILFFGASSVSLVLFPISSEMHAKGGETSRYLINSLGITTFLLVCGLVFFVFFPRFIVMTLFGVSYLSAVPYLRRFSMFMFFYTYVALLTQYFLSIYKTQIGRILALGALLEVLLIWFRHASITQIIDNLILVNVLLAFYLLVYYFTNNGSFSYRTLLQARKNN